MVTWTLHGGTEITEGSTAADGRRCRRSRRPAHRSGPARLAGGQRRSVGASAPPSWVRACTPWLPHLTAADTDVAAAMRARADFLGTPHKPCPCCGHPNGRHDGRPCLPTSTSTPRLDCRYARPAEPTTDDPPL
jgi:hypothetical protein